MTTDDTTTAPTCHTCGVAITHTPTPNMDDWHWVPVDPDADTGLLHSHHSTGGPTRQLTQAEKDAVPRHCGWPLWHGPAGWWCRQCDLPLPDQGDWHPQRAATALTHRLTKYSPRAAAMRDHTAAQPALGLLLALQYAAEYDPDRATAQEPGVRITVAGLEPHPDPWVGLRDHLLRRAPAALSEPTTMTTALRATRRHNNNRHHRRMYAVPLPARPGDYRRRGWATLTTREDHQ